jgi:hypothetical protein
MSIAKSLIINLSMLPEIQIYLILIKLIKIGQLWAIQYSIWLKSYV